MGTQPVFVFIFNTEKVVLVAGNPSLTATPANSFNRILPDVPVHHIHFMNKLFGNMVARQPAEIHPVAQHVLHVGPFRLTTSEPKCPTVADNICPGNFANRTILHAAMCFHIIFLHATDGSTHHAQTGCFRLFCRCHHRTCSHRIDRYWFFHKNMLPRIYSSFHVRRPEMWRCAKQHHIYPRFNHFFVTVKTDKTVFVGNFHVALFFQLSPAVVDFVLKNISQCSNLKVRAGIEKIGGSAGSTATAANKPGFYYLPVGRLVKQFL